MTLTQDRPAETPADMPARAATAVDVAPRIDLYRTVHKGLRRLMSRVVDGLGRADAAESASVAAALADLALLVRLCRSHAETEAFHIHAMLEARAPGALARFDADHADQESVLDRIETMAEAVRAAGTDTARDAALHDLYLAVSAFVGENFEHMAREEREIMPLLRRHLTEAEIGGIHGAIVGTMAPEKLTAFLVEMLPALAPAERQGMLAGMHQAMPAEAFAGLAAGLIGPIARRA